jgi:putative PIN family toxin of toxin-antitoxin system
VRVVLDANVLVSGLLSSTGPPAWIVEAVLVGELELALDMAIRREYEDVLRRAEFGFTPTVVDDLLAAIDHVGFLVAAALPLPGHLPDPDDEPFLAVARATDSALVTGNVKHFPPRSRQGVEVLTPRELVDRLRSGHA